MTNRKSDIEKKIKKCINILGDEELKIIATEEAILLNGNAFKLAKLTQTIIHKLLDSGAPKNMLKDMVSLPFMNEIELDKKFEEVLERLTNKQDEDKKENTNENSNKQK